MTDSEPLEKMPSMIPPASPRASVNPWTITVAVLGFLVLGIGMALMFANPNPYDDQIDLTRLLAGLGLTTIGGVMLTVWLLLAGSAWQLRHSR